MGVVFFHRPKGFRPSFFEKAAGRVLAGERKSDFSVSLVFVSKKESRELNFRYRRQNEPTDVLSFPSDEERYLGELVICPACVQKGEKGLSRAVIHGLLHLLGYEHEAGQKKAFLMKQKEERYLNQRTNG
jgi:probable rRNA maturation factor